MTKTTITWRDCELNLISGVRGAEASALVKSAKASHWMIEKMQATRWHWESMEEVEGELIWKKNFLDCAGNPRSLHDCFQWTSWSELGAILEILVILKVNDELPPMARPELIFTDLQRYYGFSKTLVSQLCRLLPESSTTASNLMLTSKNPWSTWFGHMVLQFLAKNKSPSLLDQQLSWELQSFDLNKRLSGLLLNSQTPSHEPSLGDWRSFFSDYPHEPPLNNHTIEQKRDYELAVKKQHFMFPLKKKIHDGRSFLRQNARVLTLVGLVIAFFLIPEFCVLQSQRIEEAKTLKTDEEVIFGYYEAINELRASHLRELSQSPEAKNDTWEVGQLYVFQQTRRSTLGDAGLITLTEWRKQGEPLLGEGLTVYGVDIILVQRFDLDLFEITYDKARWDLDKVENKPVVEKFVDRVRLERHNNEVRLVFIKRELTSS